MKKMLSEALTGKEPEYGVYFIPAELHKKIEDHAKQKGVSVDQEATEMLELAVQVLDVAMATKRIMKGGDQEL
jgi:hypothetical protein